MSLERDLCVDLLQKEEGYRRFAYDDETGRTVHPGTQVRGFVTVGIGRNLVGKGISPEEARYLCAQDLEECIEWCQEHLTYFKRLSAIRSAIVISMRFQLGGAGILSFRRFHAAMRAKDYEQAAMEMLDSKAAQQTPQRWMRAANMMRSGEWILS